MSSIFEKLRNILKEEEVVSSEISRGNEKDAREDLEDIENKILPVLKSERQDLEKINQVVNALHNWEEETEKLIAASAENIKLIKAGIEERNKSKILKNAAKINRRLVDNRDKVEPENKLSDSQLDYFNEINTIGKSLETVENLNQIIRRLNSKNLSSKEQKIEKISESLEIIVSKEKDLECSTTDHQTLYKEVNDIREQLSSSSMLSERELKAVKATLKNLSELIRDIGKFETEGSKLNRRDFLKIASGSFIGLAAASQIYDELEQSSNASINEENLNRTERFLYEYFKEVKSWSSGSLQLGNHVVIAENHKNMDAYISLADFISIHNPDAIGLEFFYKDDEYLKEFNRENIGANKVINHWNTHIGRGRPEPVQREILEACRKNNVDLVGLEPVKQTFYPKEGKDISYKKRSLGMSEIAVETAKKYNKTAFIVGYLHSGLPAIIPEMLLKSARPKFKGKFDVKEFYQNPLRFTEYENTKHAHLFYQNPKLRINHRLREHNLDTSLLKATSAEEQLRTFKNEYANLGRKTETTELILEKIQNSLQQLEKAQSLSLQSGNNYSIMLREPFYD